MKKCPDLTILMACFLQAQSLTVQLRLKLGMVRCICLSIETFSNTPSLIFVLDQIFISISISIFIQESHYFYLVASTFFLSEYSRSLTTCGSIVSDSPTNLIITFYGDKEGAQIISPCLRSSSSPGAGTCYCASKSGAMSQC